MKFQTLHLMRSKTDARTRERLEIAGMFGTVFAIILLLIGGSRLLVEMLAS